MENFDRFDGGETRSCFTLELTSVPPLWNHPKTVALHFASGEMPPNHGAGRSNFCSRTSVKQR